MLGGIVGTKQQSTNLAPQGVQLSTEVSWCQPQVLSTGTDMWAPATNVVRGWDTLNQCCLQEYSGYNPCYDKETKLQICYTGNVGGELKYARFEDYYLQNPLQYQQILKDLHKSNITKECNANAYTAYGG